MKRRWVRGWLTSFVFTNHEPKGERASLGSPSAFHLKKCKIIIYLWTKWGVQSLFSNSLLCRPVKESIISSHLLCYGKWSSRLSLISYLIFWFGFFDPARLCDDADDAASADDIKAGRPRWRGQPFEPTGMIYDKPERRQRKRIELSSWANDLLMRTDPTRSDHNLTLSGTKLNRQVYTNTTCHNGWKLAD